MKASPFFSKDEHAIQSREALLRALQPVALVNLSALRKENLFPDATEPALLFFSRCALVDQRDRLLVGSIPWTPDFQRNGIFYVGPGELKSVPLSRVLQTPSILKAAVFGTMRDAWLMEKLERTFPTLEQVLFEFDAKLDAQGQDFQIGSGDINDLPGADGLPGHYYSLGVVTPAVYMPLHINLRSFKRFENASLYRGSKGIPLLFGAVMPVAALIGLKWFEDRPRTPAIFKGPLLLCPKGNFAEAIEPGRYGAAVIAQSVLYNENFFAISFAERDLATARVLSAIFNSSLTAFQLAMGGRTWGLERPTVEPKDLLSLRVPDLRKIERPLWRQVLSAEAAVSDALDNAELVAVLDHAVNELYGLERDEAILASESIKRARELVFEDRAPRLALVKQPSSDDLFAYASEVVRTVNSYLRARGKRHLEAVIYPRHIAVENAFDGTPGVDAVRFAMVSGPPADLPEVRQGSDAEIARLAVLFREKVDSGSPPYINERRQLRIYDENSLLISKPSEVRYWTRTAGLNDGDAVLADHWIKGLHASVA